MKCKTHTTSSQSIGTGNARYYSRKTQKHVWFARKGLFSIDHSIYGYFSLRQFGVLFLLLWVDWNLHNKSFPRHLAHWLGPKCGHVGFRGWVIVEKALCQNLVGMSTKIWPQFMPNNASRPLFRRMTQYSWIFFARDWIFFGGNNSPKKSTSAEFEWPRETVNHCACAADRERVSRFRVFEALGKKERAERMSDRERGKKSWRRKRAIAKRNNRAPKNRTMLVGWTKQMSQRTFSVIPSRYHWDLTRSSKKWKEYLALQKEEENG